MNEAEWLASTQPWERKEQLFNTKGDMDWLIDTVIPTASMGPMHLEDKGYKSAVIYGDENTPSRVDFYTVEEPTIDMKPAFIWYREQ